MRLILIVLLLICCTPAEEKPFKAEPVEKKADFRIALEHVLLNEGWWADTPNDKGQETYAGISRRYHKDWWGWQYVDNYKKHNKIETNTHIPNETLDFWVLDFYLNMWMDIGLYNLRDQEVANYIFDVHVNGSYSGTELIQKSLRDVGYKVSIDSKMDSNVINSINRAPKKKFLWFLKKRRVNYYKEIVRRDSTQEEFLKHWLQRAK